ncbi:hypothetical protein [Xanthocytophaga agilis]|uniref:Uncharacterized protein n=1 Tax=Xanthocytophaga agilis TaxID=3048010 RepID=A0AAE3R623_9BACT|nr:hypothetical protein [Xanthocytophaga agilis]MDJ1503900.1 hypothetical protein [Xanthocytophaga agilis]
MKKGYLFIQLAILAFVLIGFSSCKKDDEVPANVIEDQSGVKVELQWLIATTNSTQSTSLSDTDLDFYLYKQPAIEISGNNTNIMLRSYNEDSYESFTLNDLTTLEDETKLVDGTYVLGVKVYSSYTNGTLDIVTTGVSTNKTYKINSTYTASQEGTTIRPFATITKSGSKYTIKSVSAN